MVTARVKKAVDSKACVDRVIKQHWDSAESLQDNKLPNRRSIQSKYTGAIAMVWKCGVYTEIAKGVQRDISSAEIASKLKFINLGIQDKTLDISGVEYVRIAKMLTYLSSVGRYKNTKARPILVNWDAMKTLNAVCRRGGWVMPTAGETE